MKALLGVVVLLLGVSPARASQENRNLVPFGEAEAFTGNAGVAGGGTSGAAYYNPARLALLDHPRLSVSGTVYSSISVHFDSFAFIDNTNVPYEGSGFTAIPSTVSSAFKVGDWGLAVSILIPEYGQFENRQALLTPNTASTIVQVANKQDMWVGFSAAHTITDSFRLGMSIFGTRHTESTAVDVITRFPALPTLASVATLYDSRQSYGLTLTLGGLVKAADWLDLGLRIQLPLLHLFSSGTAYRYQQIPDAGTGNHTITEASDDHMNARYQLPWDLTLGAKWRLSDDVCLLTDLSVQTGYSYETAPGSIFSSNVRVVAKPRINLGVEWRWSPTVQAAGGLIINPSAFPSLDQGGPGSSRSNAYGLTAGVNFLAGRVRTGVGGFFLWASGENIPLGQPAGRASVSGKAFGGILNFIYLLGEVAGSGESR